MGFSTIERALFSLDSFSRSAAHDGFLQNKAPQIKVLAVIIFIVAVLSFNKYAFAPLLPYILMLSFLTAASGVSFKSTFSRIVVVSPFVIFIGIFNPFFDTAPVLFFGIEISGGWASFLSILLKFFLTVWCSFLLISTTGFQSLIGGFRFFKMPAILANQFYFLFRYIRLLLVEVLTLQRARKARLGLNGKFDMRVFATLAGVLATRSLKRSVNIHQAMLARGFDGEILKGKSVRKINRRDIIFLAAVIFCCIFFRFGVKLQ